MLSSICPIHVADNATMDDPLFGFRPAVAAIVDHIESALSNACLPQRLAVHADGSVGCEMLEALPTRGDTCASHGLMPADADATASFVAQIQADESAAIVGTANDPALNSICEIPQLTSSRDGGDFSPAGTCPQTVAATPSGILSGAQVSLYCSAGAETGAAP